MYMTRSDLHVFCHQIHHSVAKRLGIKDVEWKCTKELADEIQQQNHQIASKMEEFLKAFEDWFLLHEQIEASRSSGNLSADQKAKLTNAIAYRDSTRRSLLDELPKV